MTSEAKQHLREQLKRKRASLSSKERAACDQGIADAVCALPQFDAAPLILTYLSLGDEVDSRALIEAAWAQGKRVALPKCHPGSKMSWHIVDNLNGLITSKFGIDEPDERTHSLLDLSEVGENAIALVPGLAFDRRRYRIGYGGGFYDRFLPDFPGIAIGLCRSAMLLESLEEMGALDAYDRSVDIVVTETDRID